MAEFTMREAVVICESMLWGYHRGVRPMNNPEYLAVPRNTPILYEVVNRAILRGEIDKKWEVDAKVLLYKIAQLTDQEACELGEKTLVFWTKVVKVIGMIQRIPDDPFSPEQISDSELRRLIRESGIAVDE